MIYYVFRWYPDNCASKKIALRLGLGFGSRSGLVLGLGGNQTIVLEERCFPVRGARALILKLIGL